MQTSENSTLEKTTIISASIALFVATLGILGYVPGLEVLGRVQQNFIPMAPSTAAIFFLQGLILFGLAFDAFRRQTITLFLMLITFLTAIFGLLEIPGDLLGIDLNFENTLVPPAGQLGDIPIARMSPLTGALFFLAGIAILLLLMRCYSQKDDLAHGAGILGSLVFTGSFVATLGYLIGTPLFYQSSTIPIALTTAFGFLWLAIAIIAVSGINSFPLLFVSGSSTQSRLMRAFLPVIVAGILIESLATLQIPALFPINPLFVLSTAVSLAALITMVIISLVSVNIGHDIDQTHEALRASEERFSLAFHNDPDVIAIMTLAGQLVDVNQGFTRLTGFSKDQVIGKRLDKVVIWANVSEGIRFLKSVQQKQKIHDYETTLETKSSERRIVVISADVVEMASKPHIILVARDITEHKKTDAALRRKDREIRKAYHNVLSAVTDGKLLILSDTEILASQGEPCSDLYRISSYEQLADFREFLRKELLRCELDQDRIENLVVAASEAVVNGVKHASSCEVQLTTVEGAVQIRISDKGPGIDFSDLPKATLITGHSTKQSMGMGFTLVLNLCDRLLLSTGADGTTLIIESDRKNQIRTVDTIISRVSAEKDIA